MAEFFNKRQRLWVGEALELAEFLAEKNLQVNLADVQRYFYDLQTLKYLRGPEKTDQALAQVCKYEYSSPRATWRAQKKVFYRICLQDDKILRAAAWESPLFLKALLLYIITHELIHVIRFIEDPRRFHMGIKERKNEEKDVHRLTYYFLKGLNDPQVNNLLVRYRPLWDDEGQEEESRPAPLTNKGSMPNFFIS